VRLNTVTAGNQTGPTVIELSDGDLLFTWQNTPTSGTANLILSRYNSTISGDYNFIGDYADNVIEGSDGDNEIRGLAGNDDLRGGKGNDYLSGGDGNDIYRFNVGDGVDTIDNQDSSGADEVVFGTGIDKQDLWFQQKNYDLTVQVLGTSDSITLQNWFVNDAQKVDQFALSDGEKLDKASVDQLIQAMAGFNPQALGAVSAITDLPQSVQNTITASWHT
jgi:Ca2+-binding RTX toxin-like protein